VEITTVRTPGLGDNTYVVVHHGKAIVVDPQRDIDRFLFLLGETNAELRYIFETHIHNDYVSGGRELAAVTGAELVLPAAGAVKFDHLPAFHNEDINSGSWSIRPIHTPGHTPEHLSYLAVVDGEPVALFSGGSLLVGSAGRPDLLGMDRARTLAHLQYLSVNRLAELPEMVGLYPTHGAGSFCTSTVAGAHTSTIGQERRSNPVLQHSNRESFILDQLAGLQPFPSYYAYMGPTNLAGPEPIPAPGLPEVAVDEIGRSTVVDIRPAERYAAGHLPGSIGIPFGDQVGVWAGWVLPFDTEVVLVAERGQDVDEVHRQFSRIGFDHVDGVVFDLPPDIELVSYEVLRLADFLDRMGADLIGQIIDVRAPNEWDEGTIEGSTQLYVPDLYEDTSKVDPSQPAWLLCGTGHRSTIAAAALERDGLRPAVLVGHGVTDVIKHLARS
jgi:glyoxylase-like metal-dependent hydrolase (beta-lactamase superfamily II)/rhodanese-related sulfurtransferase